MPGTLKKPQNNKEVINQQLHDTIVLPKVNDKGIISYLSYNGV